MLNKVMIIGNLGRDPEQRSTSSGMAVTEFSVAVNSRRKNEDHTEWFNVKLFDKQAENAATFLRKGRKVYVEGRLETRSWDDKETGQKRNKWQFTVDTIERAERGTTITLHLREGEDDFLSAWRIKSVVQKYSDHISLPILMRKEEWKEGENDQPGAMVMTDEWETVNKANALWSRAKKDVTPEQYDEFYKAISHDHEAPLAYSHNRVEGSTEYTQLLYVPSKAPFDLWNREKRGGIKLYVKRVFIMDDAEQLMPVYLRFVKGVIDLYHALQDGDRELAVAAYESWGFANLTNETIDVLNRLKPFLDRGRLPPPDCAISFQYYRGKSWVEDEIGPGGAT